MRYSYKAPTTEEHRVDWYLNDSPGIYEPGQKRDFSKPHLRLHPDLVSWLDAEAAGWSFRSDWDYSNAGDDDEGCHLRVPTREAADGFIERAGAMSRAWVEADRAAMRYLVVIETPAGDVEVYRGHGPSLYMLDERTLSPHFVMDRQPMRARVFRMGRDATTELEAIDDDTRNVRVEAALEPEDVRVPGTRLVAIRLAKREADAGEVGK